MKNRTLFLKLRTIAGSTAKQVAEDLVETANRLGLAVEADFNGTAMVAWPGGDWRSVVADWEAFRDASRRLTKAYPG